MPVTVGVETEGFERIEQVLQEAAERGADLSAGFARIMQDFYSEQKQVFDASGGFGGRTPWEPLSPRYAARKERVWPGQPILVYNGALEWSLTDAEATDAVQVTTADELFIGTSLMVGPWNLAWLHHTGTEKMPARPPIRVTEDQLERWTDILLEHLTGGSSA